MTDDARTFLDERHPDERELALWLLGVLQRAEPDLTVRVYRGWDGLGLRHPDAGYVCGLFPARGAVKLVFEHGRRLDDPAGLLEGDGSQTRHVVVERVDDGLAAPIAELVRGAVALRLFNPG